MKWKNETRKIDDLYEYAKNARQLSKEAEKHLHSSLEKFGQCEPIVINPDGTIIGGHQRVRTMRKLGYKTAEVYVPDTPLGEKEFEELNIRLNKNVGAWDFDMLANAWEPADLLDWGFTIEELHLEEVPSKEGGGEGGKDNRKSTMMITFQSPDHLQEAENRISTIVDEYEGAFYKVKIS